MAEKMPNQVVAQVAPSTVAQLAQRLFYPRVPADQMQLILTICQRYDLDPLLKQAILLEPKGNRPASLYITRDGLNHVAHASKVPWAIQMGEPERRENPYTGQPDVYLAGTLHRQGYPDMTAGLWLSEYKQVYKDSGAGVGAWGTHTASMHAKCVEVYLLRRGFDVSLPAYEEMERVMDGAVVEPIQNGKAQAIDPDLPDRPWSPELIWDRALSLKDAYRTSATSKAHASNPVEEAHLQRLVILLREAGITDEQRHNVLEWLWGKRSSTELSWAECRVSIQTLTDPETRALSEYASAEWGAMAAASMKERGQKTLPL